MSKYISRWSVPLALSLALVAGACKDDEPSGDTLAQDTTLNRDLQMANQDTAVQPALQDVAVGNEPTPVASAPAGRTSGSPGRTSSGGGTIVRTPAPPTASRPTPARPARGRTPAPARVPSTRAGTSPSTGTTSSGNTVTRTPGGAERAVGSAHADRRDHAHDRVHRGGCHHAGIGRAAVLAGALRRQARSLEGEPLRSAT